MRILQVSIENFRGIGQATIQFPSHALILGPNNACKSTILEAINLALGPDRILGADPVDEHDFFKSHYLYEEFGLDDSEEGEAQPDWEADQDTASDETPADAGDVEDVQAADAEEPNIVAPPEGRAQWSLRLLADPPDRDEDTASGDGPEIRIDVVLGDLNADQIRAFRSHVEPWHAAEFRLLTPKEAENHEPENDDFVLRVGFRASRPRRPRTTSRRTYDRAIER